MEDNLKQRVRNKEERATEQIKKQYNELHSTRKNRELKTRMSYVTGKIK